MVKKIDPIRKKYYKPLEIAEKFECAFFYISAISSWLILIIDKNQYSALLEWSQILFALVVILLATTGATIRLYLAPRAQESRYKDFISHAFDTPHYEKTKGYYNNKESEPLRRIAAQTLENSFYSKNIIVDMVRWERGKIIIYFVIWIFLMAHRSTELNIIVIITQVIFSEFLLLRWLLSEWLSCKFEKVFDNLFQLFKDNGKNTTFDSNALEINGIYEMAKASSCITLSEKIFIEKSSELDQEWKKIRSNLNI